MATSKTVKRNSRKSECASKDAAAVKEEALTQQEQRSVRRKTRTSNGDGEAGPSNRQASQAAEMAEETEHMMKLRELYKAEAETVETASISTQEGEQLIVAVMRHMLFRQHQKPDQPVRRDELNKIIQNNYKDGRKSITLGNFVIKHAQAKFPDIFGLEMKEVGLAPAARPGANARADLVKAYVLRSLLPAPLRARALPGLGADAGRALALVVIAIVNLSGGQVSKDALWEHLDKLAVVEGTAHPALGKPEEQIEAMLKQRYLVEQRQAGAHGPSVTYTVGENALDELPSDTLKGFIDQVLAAPKEDEDPEEEEAAE